MPNQKSKQFNLFEEPVEELENKKESKNETINISGLQISKQDTNKESKLKKLVDTRLKRIEKLKELFEKDQAILVKIKSHYNSIMIPYLKDYATDIEDYLELILKRYEQKSFSNGQRETLMYLLDLYFDKLFNKGHESERFQLLVDKYTQIKEDLYGLDDEEEFDEFDEFDEDYYDDENDDFHFEKNIVDEFQKQIIKSLLRDIGLEVDDDFFTGLDTEDSDFETKFQKRVFEYKQKQENDDFSEKKREKSINTDKDFTKIYKSLVKKVHPDLTTDEDERKRREVVMKELSAVWEKRDYYELLMLQAKIESDQNTTTSLSENQLQQVAEDLYDKIKELEQTRYMFKKVSENDYFFSKFYAKTDRRILLNLENYQKTLEKERKEVIKNKAQLKNQQTTKQFLKVINNNMEEVFYDDPFSIFS